MRQINAVGFLLTWFLIAANSLGQSSGAPQASAPDFVVDSAAPTQAQELRLDAEALNATQCNGHPIIYLERSISVGDFMGAKAKIVRVTRYVRGINSSAKTSAPQILKKAWNGQFKSASCLIDWDEVTVWSVEAEVKFEDGAQGKLVTDGYHIALRDHGGKNWFIRLGD